MLGGGQGLLIIDRQREIPGVGRLDLLGLDSNGQLVIIELKRDRAPREALDVWIHKNVSQISGLAVETIRAELQQRGLAVREEWQDRFWLRLSNIEQALSLVAQLRQWKPQASATAGA